MTSSPIAHPDLVRTIADNAAAVRARITAAAERSGRDATAVRLIAVTKTFPAEMCLAALEAGISDLGENRVQEGVAKAAAIAGQGAPAVWHLIGHLQSNKVKPALETFALIHSVHSVELVTAISRRAVAPVTVLLQANVAGEESKFGLDLDEVPAAYEQIAAMPNVDVRGLMTIAPQTNDPETVRPVFRRLREMAETLGLPELSMGMSGDYEVAVEEGSTMVRVGSALFGPRPARGA
ncbi:MAG: YggS family pyridoxal phosphate-dependent enzyme [Dehalococcoidia bacterium]